MTKQEARKHLTTINLLAQELPEADFKKLFRNLRAIQKYLEGIILEGGKK